MAKGLFEVALEEARRKYGLLVFGYVVMPEHIHFLVSEPQRKLLSTAIRAIKQSVARKLIGEREHFWQARYYDFNVWSASKIREKLRYMQRNPVKRGLVEKPEDWAWSSYRHYLTGEPSMVEIESEWTWKKRLAMGIVPQMRVREKPRPTNRWLAALSAAEGGHPRECCRGHPRIPIPGIPTTFVTSAACFFRASHSGPP